MLALPLQAADTGRLMRQIERGSTAERTAALRDLAKEDAPAATAKAVEWLEPNVDPALRRAAARTLWDLGDKAKSAEPALRARLDDRDDDVAYACVGALSTMGVPKAELRSARLRLARSNDGFIAFYASRALFPDPELPLDAVIDAALAGVNLVAGGTAVGHEDARHAAHQHARPAGKRREAIGTRRLRRADARVREGVAARQGSDLLGVQPRAAPARRCGADRRVARLAATVGAAQRAAALVDYHEQGRTRRRPHDPGTVPAAGARHPQGDGGGARRRRRRARRLADEQAKRSAWRSDVEKRIGPALARAATTDPDRDVRKEAADALQQLSLWAGPALGSIGDRIAQEPDPVVRHALVRACWNARESPELPRAALASLAANDPVDYVRNEAAVTLKASSR